MEALDAQTSTAALAAGLPAPVVELYCFYLCWAFQKSFSNRSPPRRRMSFARLVTSSHASSVASLQWTCLDRLVLPFYRENREDFGLD